VRQPSVDNTFDTFSRCIYCPTSLKLSREHIIPFSLGGNYVITDGSCEECGKETHAFEGFCAGQMFGHFRGSSGPSRKKGRRPKTRRVVVEFQDTRTEMDVPYGEEPPSPILVPILPPPGILFGQELPKAEYLQYKQILPAVPNLDDRLRKLVKGKTGKVTLETKFVIGDTRFLRLLAKIAHGFCVVDFGIDTFQHLLPKYILGQDKQLNFVVGTAAGPIPSNTREGHTVAPAIKHVNGKHYAMAFVQLFKELDIPTYEVIAGEASPELVRDVLARDASQVVL
jgi:hypothetical protein